MDYDNQIDILLKNEFFKRDPNNLTVLFKYFTARIDLKNCGAKDNDIIFLNGTDSNIDIEFPNWYNDNLGVGRIIFAREGVIDLEIQIVKDGDLELCLRGVDFRDRTGKRVPVYIDYTKCVINDEIIFNDRLSITHDKPYKYNKERVKDGEIVKIHIEWEPFTSEGIYRET